MKATVPRVVTPEEKYPRPEGAHEKTDDVLALIDEVLEESNG